MGAGVQVLVTGNCRDSVRRGQGLPVATTDGSRQRRTGRRRTMRRRRRRRMWFSRCWIRYIRCSPWRNYGGAGPYFLKEVQPVGSAYWSRFIPKDCSLWKGPLLEHWEKCEVKGAAERNCYGMTTTSHSESLLHDLVEGVKGVGNEGVKVRWGEKKGMG